MGWIYFLTPFASPGYRLCSLAIYSVTTLVEETTLGLKPTFCCGCSCLLISAQETGLSVGACVAHQRAHACRLGKRKSEQPLDERMRASATLTEEERDARPTFFFNTRTRYRLQHKTPGRRSAITLITNHRSRRGIFHPDGAVPLAKKYNDTFRHKPHPGGVPWGSKVFAYDAGASYV